MTANDTSGWTDPSERIFGIVGQHSPSGQRGLGAPDDGSMRTEMIRAIPSLRAFAALLCGRHDRADDLVQDTLLRAWEKRALFKAGTNLQAWLFTILRNQFFSDCRARRHRTMDWDESLLERLATFPEQHGRMDFPDFQRALLRLAPEQREALILIGASDVSYQQASEVCGCAVGTIESPVNRGRAQSAGLLFVTSAAEFGPEAQFRAG